MGGTNKAAYKKHHWSGGKAKRRRVQAALLHHHGIKSTRNRNRDATSSTMTDARRRSQDSKPSHLKYGTFRRLSKLRQSQEDPLLSPRCESKPIVVARSSVNRKRSPPPRDPLRSSISPPAHSAPPQQSPLQRPARRVHLSRTEPVHLDIEPKRFPSMLWC
ncbi:uncharacterized protein LOC134660047 [Cydia amplana]|uniref:uncharacterized protein LOC134660047 n=1 Tax=Cydia amplana TaxID=1869771 RepID=UPI002FE5D4BA